MLSYTFNGLVCMLCIQPSKQMVNIISSFEILNWKIKDMKIVHQQTPREIVLKMFPKSMIMKMLYI